MHPLHLGQLRSNAGLHHFRRAGVLHADDGRAFCVAPDTAGCGASLPGGWLPGAASDLYSDGTIYRCRTIALQAAVHVAGADRGADWDSRLLRVVAREAGCNSAVDPAIQETVFMANLTATKPIHTLMHEAHDTSEHRLKRTLGPV